MISFQGDAKVQDMQSCVSVKKTVMSAHSHMAGAFEPSKRLTRSLTLWAGTS